MRMADADLLPFEFGNFSETIQSYVRELKTLAQKSRVMAVSIETKPAFKAGQPRMLFEVPYFKSGHDIALTPDGKGFVLIRESDAQTGPGEIGVLVNWPEELRQRVK